MILKSKSIKSKRGVKNVLRYVLSAQKNKSDDFILTRFIRGDRPFEALLGTAEKGVEFGLELLEKRIENMFNQFESNNDKRKIKRKNANRVYHEIISFNKLDNDKLSSKALKRMARYYAKLRSENSLVVSAMHSDKEHLHIHNIISAVEFETGKTVRLSRSEFKDVKVNLEKWQEKYLGLVHSKVNHNKKKDQVLLKDAEYQINLKGKRSQKQLLQLQLADAYSRSKSPQQFYNILEKSDLELYVRDRKIAGIKTEKNKYRLKTLGFSKERIAELDMTQEQSNSRLKDLQQLQSRRSKSKDRDRER